MVLEFASNNHMFEYYFLVQVSENTKNEYKINVNHIKLNNYCYVSIIRYLIK